MKPEHIQQLAVALPALLISLSVHEFAHAFVATKLGDPTPMREGRLTLSPIAHIDIIGTLIFPILLALANVPVFGWAKPVQFQPANFTRKLSMWQGTVLAASAGPVSNLILGLMSVFGLKYTLLGGASIHGFWVKFFSILFQLNILLALFNLIPLPPLDGSHFIPERMSKVRDFLTRYSFILFLGIFLLPMPGLGMSLGSLVLYPATQFVEQLFLSIARIGSL